MIHHLKRSQIDEVKYNNCIKKAVNSRIYAYTWYLDIVADNWDALILNDYEAVMPLPWRSKYFIKYVYPPAWTQQLGVFSQGVISEELILRFIKTIPSKFRKITIQFNSGNNLSSVKTEKRVNYILPLNESYEDLFMNYRRDRKNRIIQSQKRNLKLERTSFKEILEIAKTEYQFLKVSDSYYEKLDKLSEILRNIKNGILLGVYNEKKALLCGTIILLDTHRLVYLFSVSSKKGKENQAASFLINEVMKKYSQNDLVFDFEGSMIDGVADFYKSFGARVENYNLFRKKIII